MGSDPPRPVGLNPLLGAPYRKIEWKSIENPPEGVEYQYQTIIHSYYRWLPKQGTPKIYRQDLKALTWEELVPPEK